MPLAEARNRGGGGGLCPGESGRRRRGRRGGTARGGHALPLGGLDWGCGRPEGARRRAVLEAAVADSGGAAPAALGGGERVGELRHGERKLAAGSTRAERRRRWGLRGEPELCGSNGGGHGRGSGRARLGLLGPEREGGDRGGKALPRSNRARRVKERGAVPGVVGAGVCGVAVAYSPSSSSGRGRDAARRGLGVLVARH